MKTALMFAIVMWWLKTAELLYNLCMNILLSLALHRRRIVRKSYSTSKKRKRTSSDKDDLIVDGIKDACSVMAEKFSEAMANLANTMKLLAHKHKAKAQAGTLWTEMRKIEGLTQHEMHAGYDKIINNEMLLVGFKDIPVEEKAAWIRFLIS